MRRFDNLSLLITIVHLSTAEITVTQVQISLPRGYLTINLKHGYSCTPLKKRKTLVFSKNIKNNETMLFILGRYLHVNAVLNLLFIPSDIQRYLHFRAEEEERLQRIFALQSAESGFYEFLEFNITISILYILVFFWGILGNSLLPSFPKNLLWKILKLCKVSKVLLNQISKCVW